MFLVEGSRVLVEHGWNLDIHDLWIMYVGASSVCTVLVLMACYLNPPPSPLIKTERASNWFYTTGTVILGVCARVQAVYAPSYKTSQLPSSNLTLTADLRLRSATEQLNQPCCYSKNSRAGFDLSCQLAGGFSGCQDSSEESVKIWIDQQRRAAQREPERQRCRERFLAARQSDFFRVPSVGSIKVYLILYHLG